MENTNMETIRYVDQTAQAHYVIVTGTEVGTHIQTLMIHRYAKRDNFLEEEQELVSIHQVKLASVTIDA